MLVLSRRVGERIVIGQGVVVTVLAAEGQRIRLGVEAPRAVPVVRDELCGPDGGEAGLPPTSPPRHGSAGAGQG